MLIKQLIGADKAADKCWSSCWQVLIKQLIGADQAAPGADQLAEKC